MKLLIDLKKYQEKEFLLSIVALAVGSILLIAFFISFSIYVDSETKSVDVDIKSFQIGKTSLANVLEESTSVITTTMTTAATGTTATNMRASASTTVTVSKTTHNTKSKTKVSVKQKKTTTKKYTTHEPTTVITTVTYPNIIKTASKKSTYLFQAKPIKKRNVKKTKVVTTNNNWNYKVVTNKKGGSKNRK